MCLSLSKNQAVGETLSERKTKQILKYNLIIYTIKPKLKLNQFQIFEYCQMFTKIVSEVTTKIFQCNRRKLLTYNNGEKKTMKLP